MPLIAGGFYLGFLALPYAKKLYYYLFAPGGLNMEVADRHIYREDNCGVCLEACEF